MAPTTAQVEAEILIRLPGSETAIPIGTVTIPLKVEDVAEGFVNVTPDLSVFERMAQV